MKQLARRVVAVVAGVLSSVGAVGAAPAEAGFDLDADTRVGEPLVHRNLLLYPLHAKGDVDPREYLVLDEGMKKGVVVVEEDGGGTVNALALDNRSSQPLFVMSGEVVLGGKQDRIIGKDTIVPPRTKVSIGVYCVEHGRWTGRDRRFRSAGSMAHSKLRTKAKYHAQGDVWEEVAAKNVQRKEQNDTDTYRRVATGTSVAKAVGSYERHFEAALARLPSADTLVGFVAVLDGKVIGVEAFASPKLFRKVGPKLLRSYYVEALDHPVPKGEPARASAEDIRAFTKRAAEAEREVVVQQGKSRTEHRKARGQSASYLYDEAEVQGARPAKPVYRSVNAE